MISGLGFFEIILVLLLVLMFFGSKELPHFIRESGKLLGKLRRYSNKVRRELNEVSRLTDPQYNYTDEISEKKKKIRTRCLNARKALTQDEREQKSKAIIDYFFKIEEFKRARSVMIYVATKTEVQTYECIKAILSSQKRVVIPFCRMSSSNMGIAEIKDISEDLVEGSYKIQEPKKELHDNFFRSDLQLIVCPGVGFDKNGARLGRGKGYYDKFLKEIKDKIPIIGFAFQCQMLDESLPFDYHDIPVDIVITEEGIKVSGQRA